MSYNYLAENEIGVEITNAKDKENLSHIKENITNYSNAACKIPDLDPFHSSVIHFMKDLGKLRCNGVSYSSFENNCFGLEEMASFRHSTERLKGLQGTILVLFFLIR